jgi:hypothetical protein
MAKHELIDTGDLPTYGTDVFYEQWSRSWWRYEPDFHQWVSVGKSRSKPARHWMRYSFYEEMPIGSVVKVRGTQKQFARRVSTKVWEWIK